MVMKMFGGEKKSPLYLPVPIQDGWTIVEYRDTEGAEAR